MWDDGCVVARTRPPESGDLFYRGWVVVEPRRHVTALGDLDDEEARTIGWLLVRIAGALRAACPADRVYAVAFADLVPHVHWHLLPRHPGTPPELRGWTVGDWPGAPRDDSRARSLLAARLREALSSR